MEIVLRWYREEDLEALCRLDEACFTPEFQFDEDAMRRFIEQRRAIVVIAEVGERAEIGGFVIVHLEGIGRTVGGYVATLDVGEQWRRMGLASRLMKDAERQARESGALWMALHVFVENKGAISFYERSGYVRGERIAGFYSGMPGARRMDAWVYRKWIGA